ncbi:MAG: TolB family protein, partial [Candidatus Aminicenantales bacterium]
MKKIGGLFGVFLLLVPASFGAPSEEDTRRPMTFMDILHIKRVGRSDLSPDGGAFIFEVSSLDWKENRRFSDLFFTQPTGVPARQMTYTKKKNERSPKWHPDGSLFAFLSDRTGKDQVYFMRPDGGEAWQVTEAKDGVISFDWDRQGMFLAYLAGKEKDRQLWIIGPEDGGKARPLTKHATPVEDWEWSLEGDKIYFLAPDTYDETEKKRIKEGFDARIIDPPKIPRNIWVVEVSTGKETRLTSGEDYSVRSFVPSDDGRLIAFLGASTNRYASRNDVEVFLLRLETGTTEQLTANQVAEGSLSFSPDGTWLGFVAP